MGAEDQHLAERPGRSVTDHMTDMCGRLQPVGKEDRQPSGTANTVVTARGGDDSSGEQRKESNTDMQTD